MNRQMAYSIYVSGTGYSGKTALCLGLFGKLQEMGLRVGYFKPVGMGQKLVDGKLRDTDVVLMKEVMALEEDLDELCPVVLGKRYRDIIAESCDDSRDRIMEAGTDGYLAKPLEKKIFLQNVEGLLKQKEN